MYPRIDSNATEEEVVSSLSQQVSHLMQGDSTRFRRAMSVVLFYRYSGRFRNYYRRVATFLGGLPKPKRREKQLLLSI